MARPAVEFFYFVVVFLITYLFICQVYFLGGSVVTAIGGFEDWNMSRKAAKEAGKQSAAGSQQVGILVFRGGERLPSGKEGHVDWSGRHKSNGTDRRATSGTNTGFGFGRFRFAALRSRVNFGRRVS